MQGISPVTGKMPVPQVLPLKWKRDSMILFKGNRFLAYASGCYGQSPIALPKKFPQKSQQCLTKC
jgi:hypothetical protein